MKSLLPKHLQDLLNKHRDQDQESRKFSADSEFNLSVSEIARQSGASKEETLRDLAKVGQQQLANERENLLRWGSLTQREREVVALICMGHRNYQVAEVLGVGHATVKSHLQNIFEKFGWRSRGEIRLALKDWDFETWWQHRHELPTPTPPTSIYR